ncbi:MAG: hypothetical protein WDW19_04135 [Neisseriaceae bacterium]
MNKKAELFQLFIHDNNLQKAFHVSEHYQDTRNFVLFTSSVEIEARRLKLAVILEEGLPTLIRVWIGSPECCESQDTKKLLRLINELNLNYKSFKFFLDEKKGVLMDWINATSDELFDPNLIHFMLGIINREAKTVYAVVFQGHVLSH